MMEMPKARDICCAIRGHPQVGFRCFMLTTAAMTSWLGPLEPGFLPRSASVSDLAAARPSEDETVASIPEAAWSRR